MNMIAPKKGNEILIRITEDTKKYEYKGRGNHDMCEYSSNFLEGYVIGII